MSILVDQLILNRIQLREDDNWYIAKPIIYAPLSNRIIDAIDVLRNKKVAIHFKEDEFNS